MAAKMLLSLLAALCCIAALNATPALRSVHHDADKQLKKINATQILEDIEMMLDDLEEKIQDVSDEVESAISAIMEGVTNAALELADKWDTGLQNLVDKATTLGVDVQPCIDEHNQRIAALQVELLADGQQCVADQINDILEEVDELMAMRPKARAILDAAVAKVEECLEKNVLASATCLAGALPKMVVQMTSLVTKASVKSGLILTKIGVAVPLGSLCTTRVSVGVAAQASAITKDTTACIKGKL